MQSMIGSVTERELGSECAAAAQAFVLWTLVSEGVELDRLDGGVFAILDTITEAVAKLDLAGEWSPVLPSLYPGDLLQDPDLRGNPSQTLRLTRTVTMVTTKMPLLTNRWPTKR